MLLPILVLVSVAGIQAANPVPRELGSFQLKHAGFVEIFQKEEPTSDPADQYTLFISTFNFCKFCALRGSSQARGEMAAYIHIGHLEIPGLNPGVCCSHVQSKNEEYLSYRST